MTKLAHIAGLGSIKEGNKKKKITIDVTPEADLWLREMQFKMFQKTREKVGIGKVVETIIEFYKAHN